VTLRSVERGWNAKGRLAPLWSQLEGPAKRDQLADLTGITPTTLSAYNSGNRPLGIANARRIVEALGDAGVDVSLLELGAPAGEADARGQRLVDRLEELADRLSDSMERQAKLTKEVSLLRARVRKLEERRGLVAAAPSSRRGAAR
jgi:transcriptional regulator with XRE-family HTH domain